MPARHSLVTNVLDGVASAKGDVPARDTPVAGICGWRRPGHATQRIRFRSSPAQSNTPLGPSVAEVPAAPSAVDSAFTSGVEPATSSAQLKGTASELEESAPVVPRDEANHTGQETASALVSESLLEAFSFQNSL